MADHVLAHEDFPFHYEERLQRIIRLAALIPSLQDGLIQKDGITLSGDGTCVHSHASPYGRCVYTKSDWDIRLYTPVPRDTQGYQEIYNNRTSCERVNNRILNDYHLHGMSILTKKRYSFFTMVIGINIHHDARMKKHLGQAA